MSVQHRAEHRTTHDGPGEGFLEDEVAALHPLQHLGGEELGPVVQVRVGGRERERKRKRKRERERERERG